MSLSNAQKAEIQTLVAAGQKIVAVKRFREFTGVGLEEALHAVMQLSGSQPDSLASKTHAPLASARPAAEANPKGRLQGEATALAALKEGDAIEAIKRYRSHTHVSLKEAKDAVDALSVVHQSSGRVSPRVAGVLVGLLRAGKSQEALTHLMSNVGYEEADAKVFLKSLKGFGKPGGGVGCVIVLLAALMLFGIAFSLLQGGLPTPR